MYAIQIHTAYSLTHNYWMNQGEKYLAQRNLDKSVRNNYKCPLNLIRRFTHPNIPSKNEKKKDAVPGSTWDRRVDEILFAYRNLRWNSELLTSFNKVLRLL